MTHDAMLQVSGAMLKFGGSFVQALATAWRHADESNAAKIEAAFPEYIEKYRAMAEKREPQ
jgi:hypothetical protein